MALDVPGESRSSEIATDGQVDERLHYTYSAIYTTPALGIDEGRPQVGNYVQAFYDKDGQHGFDGSKNVQASTLPPNVPAGPVLVVRRL